MKNPIKDTSDQKGKLKKKNSNTMSRTNVDVTDYDNDDYRIINNISFRRSFSKLQKNYSLDN